MIGKLLAAYIILLKQFRDKFLLTNKVGSAIAHFIAKRDILKYVVRVLLYLLIAISYLLLNARWISGVIFMVLLSSSSAYFFWYKQGEKATNH
jgi:hypothetical protein